MIARFHGMMKIGLMLDFGELRLERVLCGVLHGRIERGVDRHTTVIDLVLCQQQIQIALHRVHRVILLNERHTPGVRGNLCLFGSFRIRKRKFL